MRARVKLVAALMLLALCSYITTGTASAGSIGVLSRLPSTGRLALRWGPGLYVYDGAQRALHPVALATGALDPSWSRDGRYLSFQIPGGPLAGVTGIPYVAGADGQRPGTILLDGVPPAIRSMAWSPKGDILALDVRGPGEGRSLAPGIWLWRPRTGGHLVVPARKGSQISDFAWSPDGRSLVYVVTPTYRASHWNDVLYRATLSGAKRKRLFVAQEAGIRLAAPWPTGGGVMFWVDPLHSSSLAADGLALMSLAYKTRQARRLATTLAYSAWISWKPGSAHFIAVQGGGREAWMGKSLIACDASNGKCHSVPQHSGLVTLYPSWSPNGKVIAFVRGAARPNPSSVATWLSTSRLWVSAPNGQQAHRKAGIGGVQGAVWLGPTGPLLVVAKDSLWLVGGKGTATRVVGPLLPGGQTVPGAFYGYADYGQVFSWWAGRSALLGGR